MSASLGYADQINNMSIFKGWEEGRLRQLLVKQFLTVRKHGVGRTSVSSPQMAAETQTVEAVPPEKQGLTNTCKMSNSKTD